MGTKCIFALIVLFSVFFLAMPPAESIKYADDFHGNYVSDEVIVKLKIPEKLSFSDTGVKTFGMSERFLNLKIPKGQNMESFLKKIRNNLNVEYAEPNYLYTVSAVPNDVDYILQWSHLSSSSELGWNITTGSPDVVIAIIDTGVEWNHPDLAANIWNNTDEDCDNSTDLDGNGYYGDCMGYDFVDFSLSQYCYPGEDCADEDNNPADFNGHGTHCSGIAAGSGNNSIGIAGVCWNCKIMPVRAGFTFSGGSGVLADDDIVQAIIYAADNGVDIISMSFSGPFSESIKDAVDYAYSKGVILVAAAGNEESSEMKYPAAFNNVISVAATDENNYLAEFSNYGSWVDIAAPGNNIISTIHGGYDYLSGTSMATPFVAGVLGLMKSVSPSISHFSARSIIMGTSDAIYTPVAFGKINVYESIMALDTAPGIVINSPVNATIGSDYFNFTYDNVECSWYSIDSRENVTKCDINNSEWVGNFSSVSDGPHVLMVWANNSMGSQENRSVYWTRNADPPEIDVISPLNTTYNISSILFTMNSDETTQMCTVDYGFGYVQMNETNNTWTHENSTMGEGSYYTNFYCNDSYGFSNTYDVVFTIDYCTPIWYEVNGTCSINDTIASYYTDENNCYSVTGFESDNSPPDNRTYECDYCLPNITNTSWGEWYDITNCTANDTLTQERNKTEYDIDSAICYNITGLDEDLFENITHHEQKISVCDYCEPDWIEINTTCNTTDAKTGYYTDSNECFNQTGLSSDAVVPLNKTYTCDYCLPNWTCQSYGNCTPENISYCESIIDLNSCFNETGLESDNSTGNYSEFDQVCEYVNITLPYCGDNTCDSGEDCSSCSADCGPCPTLPSGNNLGGGFFISSPPKVCEEFWVCTEWSECDDSLKTRECTDENECNTTKDKPDEKRYCEMPKIEKPEPVKEEFKSETPFGETKTEKPISESPITGLIAGVEPTIMYIASVIVLSGLIIFSVRRRKNK